MMDCIPCTLYVIPECVQILDLHALLFYPGVVLQVVDALAGRIGQLFHDVRLQVQHMQIVIKLCILYTVGSVHLIEFFDTASVHHCRVRKDGTYNVMLCELIVLRHLDAAQDVRDAADSKPGELLDHLRIKLQLILQICLSFRCVEQAEQSLGILIIDIDHHIRVLYIVDPRNVLVADAFDPVTAEAVVQQGRALKGLTNGQLQMRIQLLQAVACGHGSCGA